MIGTLNRALTAPSLAWRGIVSVIFGVVALAWPGITLAALTLLYGAYAMADGVFTLIVAARGKHPHRWLLVLDGALGIGVGVVTMFWPGITMLILIFMIGARFLIMGALEIAAAIRLRKLIPTPFLYGLGGFFSLVVGVLAFVWPGLTAVALVTILGVYALFFGGAFLALAVTVWRQSRRETHAGTPAHAT
jgi:uncharacterized membrane protein HdeD (DUF308 family)